MNPTLAIALALLCLAAPLAAADGPEETVYEVTQYVGPCILIDLEDIPPFSVHPSECIP